MSTQEVIQSQPSERSVLGIDVSLIVFGYSNKRTALGSPRASAGVEKNSAILLPAVSSSAVSLQWTWTSPVLDPCAHTVRFVFAGGGTHMDIDAIQIE